MKGKHAKNTASKLKLAKRTLALCFAVVFLCSCMLPVFATGSSLTDVLREAVEETAASAADTTESSGGTMMDSFQSYYASYTAEYKTTYRFWLDEKSSYDLEDITSTSASELAQYDDFYKVVTIENNTTLTAPDGFKNPTDPTGEGRKFEGWYYIDTYGLTQTFQFDDSPVNIDKSSTIDVFAKWGEAPAEEPAEDEDKTTEEPKADDTVKDDTKADDDKAEDFTPPAPTEDEETVADDGILMTSVYDDMVALAAATGDTYTVKVNESITITGKTGDGTWNGWHYWEQSGSGSVKINTVNSNQQNQVIVTGNKAGTVTIGHRYYLNNSGWQTEYFTIKVTSSGGTTALDPRTTNFTFSITDADVIYVHYDSTMAESDVEKLTFNTVTTGFTTNWDHAYDNYWLFFVKPDDNYMVTGIGASGTSADYRNDIYSVDGDYSKIANYPGIEELVKRAKALGYVGMFGYSRKSTDGSSFTSADIKVVGEQPPITVKAVSDKTENVKPGDELEFTVTITPGHTDGKASTGYTAREDVIRATIESLMINGVDYKDFCTELVPHYAANGKTIEYYTTTVKYTATRQDCNNGLVKLDVDASVDYNVKLNAQDNDTVKTEATIRSSASTECLIAPQSQVRYIVNIADKFATYPDALEVVPTDTGDYYSGEWVSIKTTTDDSTYPYDGKTVDDLENGGVWTFDGWYLGDNKVTTGATMTDDGLVFEGVWRFTKTMSAFNIAKVVTGNIGDLDGEYSFTITVKDANDQGLDFKLNDAVHSGNATFTLKNGQSIPLTSVPMGAIITITETGADGYKVNATFDTTIGDSIKYLGGWQDDGGTFTFTVAQSSVQTLSLDDDDEAALVLMTAVNGGEIAEGNTITIVNNKEIPVPTGVILDTLPYILMLAAVGGGAIAFFLRKRHHDDED